MSNSKQKICLTSLLLLFVYAGLAFAQTNQKVFVMVHTEAGRDTSHPLFNQIIHDELGYPPDSLATNSLFFQQITWPSIVHMVQTADSFDIKLSLALQSQMAEYILQDPAKINIFENWVQNGHELAVHHHGINHIDWGGYTNRFQGTPYPGDNLWLDKFQNSGLYRGNMQEGYSYLQQLASALNESIVSGCITDTQIDKPDEIVYLTEGGDPDDLISVPDTVNLPNETFYFLSHCQLVSVYKDDGVIIEDDSINHQLASERLELITNSLSQVDDDEVMGIVYHAFDYYRFPDIYSDLFSFLSQSQVNSSTIRGIMESWNVLEAPVLRIELQGSDVNLEWNVVPGAAAYRVVRLDEGLETTLAIATETHYTDHGALQQQGLYNYVVYATDGTELPDSRCDR